MPVSLGVRISQAQLARVEERCRTRADGVEMFIFDSYVFSLMVRGWVTVDVGVTPNTAP